MRVVLACVFAVLASSFTPTAWAGGSPDPQRPIMLAQGNSGTAHQGKAQPTQASKNAAGKTAGKNCRREPVWGFRISLACGPSGICNDRVIKDYKTVCD